MRPVSQSADAWERRRWPGSRAWPRPFPRDTVAKLTRSHATPGPHTKSLGRGFAAPSAPPCDARSPLCRQTKCPPSASRRPKLFSTQIGIRPSQTTCSRRSPQSCSSAWLRRIPRTPREARRLRLRGLRTNRREFPPSYSLVAATRRSLRRIPAPTRHSGPSIQTMSFRSRGILHSPKRSQTLGCRSSIVNSSSHFTARGLCSAHISCSPFLDLPLISLFSVRMLSSRSQGGIYMSVNKVILVGRLGRDPETRYTGGGQAFANFSVATEESYKDKNGERQKRTEWHKIVVWGKQAEIAQQYLKKGSLIFIEGRIQSREWQDKEGQKRTSFEIVASNFRMLGGRSEGAAAASAGGGAGARSGGDDFESHAAPADDSYGGGAPASGGPEISDEDIPF